METQHFRTVHVGHLRRSYQIVTKMVKVSVRYRYRLSISHIDVVANICTYVHMYRVVNEYVMLVPNVDRVIVTDECWRVDNHAC